MKIYNDMNCIDFDAMFKTNSKQAMIYFISELLFFKKSYLNVAKILDAFYIIKDIDISFFELLLKKANEMENK